MTALLVRWTLADDWATATWWPMTDRHPYDLAVRRGARGWTAEVRHRGRRYAVEGHDSRDDARTWCEWRAWELRAEAAEAARAVTP